MKKRTNKKNPPASTEEGQPTSNLFPIVGIGASAGGLKAFELFFKAVPENSGLAFVLIQHLAPDHESELAQLLQNHTHMNVLQVEAEPSIEPNHVYVIPPGKSLVIKNRVLYLSEPQEARGHRSPIDLFFRSLAEDQGENAVGIVLSGTGADGTAGLKAIKEVGGVTMVQSPAEAEYDGMPRNAIQTGLIDVIGPVAELAEKLVTYQHTLARIHVPAEEHRLPRNDSEALDSIFIRLRTQTGHDFTNYKRSTILRRIARRLHVNQIESISAYVNFLDQNPEENQALFKNFLISVTNFFRDPDAFYVLEEKIVPELFKNKGQDDQVRVWVAGCATGEEAYSLAILLIEYATQLPEPPDIQIFATDIDSDAIAFAREGCYPSSITVDVSPARLQRFFSEEEGSYRVKKELRECILFAVHNLIKDPPFSRMDLISCRNLLIYLNRDVQDKVYALFTYALKPGGYLFLGSSESADTGSSLFTTYDKQQHLFQRHEGADPIRLPALPLSGLPVGKAASAKKKTDQTLLSLEEVYQNWSLKQYTPPRLLVDENYLITHRFGKVGRYLAERDGPVNQSLLDLILPDLRLDLRAALYQAFHHQHRTETRPLRVELDDEVHQLRLIVGPVEEEQFPTNIVEVVFEERENILAAGEPDPPRQNDSQLVAQLEEELQRTREQLQATIEEQENANEELTASNEELQSMNEELQSASEELETSKEELQSINEELMTVNQELKSKIIELSHAYNDLQNLTESTDIATIFLDRNLLIKRFTPRTAGLFNIISSDVGRPFSHLSHRFIDQDLAAAAETVLRQLTKIERTAQTTDNCWYVMRIFPYRTLEDRIDGVVLTFYEITNLKEAEARLARRSKQQAMLAEMGQLALQDIPLDKLFATTTQQVCETLDLELCKVLELNAESNRLWFKAGYGWQAGYVAQAWMDMDETLQAGYTFQSQEPIIIEDWHTEARFKRSPLLIEHNVVSGMNVRINGLTKPYGVLGAHSTKKQHFSQDDIHFLQAVANLLAEAVERHRAAETIRFQANLLKAVQQAVIATDLLGNIIYWNEFAEKTYGWPEEEVLGRKIVDILVTSDKTDQAQITLDRLRRTGVSSGEYNLIRRDGSPVTVYSTTSVVHNTTGEMIGMVGVSLDITERKQMERALKASENRFRRAIVDAPFPIFIHSESGKLVQLSHAVVKLTGYDPLELKTTKDWTERAYGEQSDDVTAKIQKLFELDHPVEEGEFTVKTKDGRQLIWTFSSAPLGLDDDGNRLTISMAADITRRKEIEDALRESEARFRQAADAAPALIWMSAEDKGYVYVNSGWLEFTGRPVSAELGDGWTKGLHPEDYRRVLDIYHAAFDRRQPFQTVYRLRRHDHVYRWIWDEAVPRYTPEGVFLGYIGVCIDITEQKDAEAALQERESDLKALTESLEQRVIKRTAELTRTIQDLDQFAYVASHDLKTPLRAIDSLASWIAEDAGDLLPEASQEHLRKLRGRVKRLEGLLNDLLAYSRAGREHEERQQINTRKLVNYIAQMIEPPPEFEIIAAPDLPILLTNRVPLETVLRNLISNAINHHHRDQGKVLVSAREAGDWVEFRVEDDGPGIAPIFHERIFGMFQTLRPRDEGEGSGMGLALVKKIVENFGGKVGIISAEGDGSIFWFTWPK